jgi:hypothetical protein
MTAQAPTVRKGSTPEERKAYWERQQRNAIAVEKQREMWGSLNQFIHRRGGFLVSPPGDPNLRLEVAQYSELPDELHNLGFRLAPCGTLSGFSADASRLCLFIHFRFRCRGSDGLDP